VVSPQGECAGTCDGACQGRCDLEAGGACPGTCDGTCEYTPPSSTCPAGATARCEAVAGGTVDCRELCEGIVSPPRAKAECEASATADAALSATCAPPRLSLDFQLSAAFQGAANAAARAEFLAWLDELRAHVSAILAYRAKAAGLARAGAALATSAGGAVKGSIDAQAGDDVSLAVAFGLGCALGELPLATQMVRVATSDMAAPGEAVATVLAVLDLRD
jgi:hypothetical protein